MCGVRMKLDLVAWQTSVVPLYSWYKNVPPPHIPSIIILYAHEPFPFFQSYQESPQYGKHYSLRHGSCVRQVPRRGQWPMVDILHHSRTRTPNPERPSSEPTRRQEPKLCGRQNRDRRDQAQPTSTT